MGWFESQIEERERADNEMLEQSLAAIASAISGRISAGGTDVAAHASTAVSAILKYYGISLRGEEISTKDIEDALEGVLRKYGMMSRAVSLTDGWQHDAAGAMLGFLDDDTPVALLPRVRGGYVYLSPETGKTEHVDKGVAKRLKREAYCFYRPLPNRALRLRDLLIYMIGSLDMSDYAIIIAATAAAQLLGMVSPAVNRLVFSDAILSGSTSIIFPLASLLLSVSISSLLLGAIRSLVTNRISTKVDLPRDAALYMRTLSLPASFFGKYQTGDLSSRISAVQTVSKLMHDMVFGTLLTSVFSLAYLFQIGTYAPSLVGPSIVVVIINSVFSVVSALVQKRVTKENLKVGAKLSGWEYALISGIQKVKLAGAEKRAFATWANLYQEQARLTYNGPSILRLSGTIQTVISLTGTIVMYAAALSNNVSVSDYMGFTAAFGGITGAFTSVTSAAIQIANIRPHIDMAKPILEATPESTEDSEPVDRISGGFELDHVTFTYEGAPDPVLTDFSLKVSRGSYVAVVGETGCGKSTLVRLLLGFEKPQRGAVCYDGRDLSRLNMRDVRRNIGVVLQDGKLLRGSIYDNIAISAPGLSLDDAWHAAELAGFADDVKAMPMGMQTLISEGGGGLSGGQKQRLMIARAVAGNPKLLIFDEATSALDNITQRKVSESLDALNCTRLVIAHRLSTIKNCDRIVLIEHGRIAEDGTFDELMQLNGAFADLVARQQV